MLESHVQYVQVTSSLMAFPIPSTLMSVRAAEPSGQRFTSEKPSFDKHHLRANEPLAIASDHGSSVISVCYLRTLHVNYRQIRARTVESSTVEQHTSGILSSQSHPLIVIKNTRRRITS